MSDKRPILPRPQGASSSEPSHFGPTASTGKRPSEGLKRSVVKAACEPCRKRKIKCDGVRPKCDACTRKGIDSDCKYPVEPGQSRYTNASKQVLLFQRFIEGLNKLEDKTVGMVLVSELCTDKFRDLESAVSRLTGLDSETMSPFETDGMDEPTDAEDTPDDRRWYSADGSGERMPIDMNDFHSHESPAPGNWQDPTDSLGQASSTLPYYMADGVQDDEPSSPDLGKYVFIPWLRTKHLLLYRDHVRSHIPIQFIQISNEIDDHECNTLYTEFIKAKQQLLANGHDMSEVIGLDTINPSKLLSSEDTPGNGPQSISQWANGIVGEVRTMCIAEKLATMIMITSLARWQILPNLEHYESIPKCMIPTPCQVAISHPAWMDYIPWPEIRDHFIKLAPDVSSHTNIVSQLMQHTHLNWPHNQQDMVLINPLSGTLIIREDFEVWAKDINNWSLNSTILKHFPALEHKAWIKNHDRSISPEQDMDDFRDLIEVES
ncbi:hypothetical protein BT63DRAFT_416597 [Microthyrium microscopicum]|uniref:Zn(2)-C6 fungal-type domain-containing protein n=1 Tax=Microthyrium microscopicum TaxID=703497 RepID=A0A6A6U5H2_9PEZI|nr:hypothetical protein BT63DRAFT_416597 [Microthyrium microscopicum]